MAGQVPSPRSTWPNYKNIYVLIAYGLLLHGFTGLQPWRAFQRQQQNGPRSPAVDRPLAEIYFKPMADLVEAHGYRLEEHFVTTADGFILRLFRIPGHSSPCHGSPKAPSAQLVDLLANSTDTVELGFTVQYSCQANQTASCRDSSSCHDNSNSIKPVVFLQHALMDSSAGWLLLGPSKALALQLSDAGFDVWMGNSRGNRYSRNHTTLQPEDPEFWAWSWDHMAELDLPASINYSLKVSAQDKLVYIGYSQGTMIGLAALSSQPQLAAKVSLAILMAPVAFTTSMTSAVFVLSSKLGMDRYVMSKGFTEWAGFRQRHANKMQPVCKLWPGFCLSTFTTFCGAHPRGNVKADLVPRMFQHLPAGTSVQVLAHWAQGIRRRSTSYLYRFDFGSDCSAVSNFNSSTVARPARCNQHVYGQVTPPEYDMAAITTPLALFTGGRDSISSCTDIELLKQKLQPGVLQLHHQQPDYAHLDFEVGTDAPEIAYPELVQLAVKFGMRK